MSISVYYGRAGSGKTRAVYERIRQVMTDCPGEPIILLVPEPATYRVERELAEFMPEKGFTTVRVRRLWAFGLSGISIDRLKRGWSIKFIKLWPVYVVAPCNEAKAKGTGAIRTGYKAT